MNWDNYYKRKTQQNKQSITWDDYYKQRKPEVQQYATESLYNPSYKPKKTYNDADFAPFQVQWQYKWDYPYKESDYLEQLRKMRNLPPQSVISQYDFSNKDDVKRFNEGLPSLSMEMQETNKNIQKDIELYQKERQRLFEQALARKQAEADKKWDWFGLAPKKVEYIDPEEYAPAMPESLSAWQGYLNDLADYNEKLELMDPDEKAYRRAIGNLPKPPDKPGFDLEQFVKWEDLQRDLWEEYLDKQAKQEVQPTVAPTVAPTNTPTGNVQKGAQQLFPMWNKQGGPTSPVPTPAPTVMPTPTPTVQPIGTPMPTPMPTPMATPQPTREPATFGEFQRLQEQQRQEAEQQQGQWKGYNRPVGGTVGTQPDIPSRSPFASGSREALYKAGESKGFGDFQKLQNDMEQERQQSGDPFTAKDILPFVRRLSNVAAHTVSGGNASTFINLESWAKRMEQIVDELDTTTDAERYDELVSEYNTLLERYQNEYQAIDTGNEKANKIADTIGSLIGIGAPIPGAGFTKLEPFRPIGSAVSERVGRPISNLLTKAAEKGASDAAVRGLYFAYQTIPAGVGSAVQFSAMQAMTNVIDPNYEDLSTKEKLEAVGNSALWGLILGSGSAAIKEAVRVGTSYAKPFVVNKVNPKIREIANKPWVNKLLQDKNIAEIRVDKNGNLNPNGGKTGIYMVKDNVTGQIKIQVDGTNTLNVAPRAAWLRAMINEAGETAKEGAKETAKEAVTIGLIGSGGGTPKAKQTKAPAVSIPVGSKVTLKGLGEVEVLSETATHVKIRRANGKELDVLKTAFSKGLDKATKKEVSTKTNIQDQFKLTERGQKQLDELLDNPYVDIKQISAPKVDLADGEVLLYRRDRNDRVITNDKAQGLYTTPVYDGNAYTAHEDVGDKDIFIKAKIDNMLTVPPMVERTHRHEKIELSAGAGALKMLDEAEFNKLNSMSKDKAMAYVKQKYPNLNIDNYSYDAYELMEVVGAEKARQHGYDAIYANNEMDPSLNEVVLLTNNFEIIDNAPLKTPTSPVEASKQQDIQTQEEEAKTQPDAEIEAISRVVDDSQYGRSGKLAFNKLINDRGIDIESPEGQQFVTKFNEYYNAAMSRKARPNFADESDLELATFAYNAGEGDRTEVRAGSKAQATTEPITETDIIDSKIPTPEDTSSSIVQVDPKDIKVDTKRFQFKLDVDPKTGAGKGLDIEKWDENLAGVMLVWEAENGDRFIVNGHHRLAKANELGVDRINAMIVRETDGISDVDAKLLGAKINIAEGHGSITDAAKLFRDGGYTLEQLKAEGLPMKSGNAQKGYAIAQLTDNLFNKVVDKVITENQGAIIGEKIPSDGGINDARQEFILKQLMNKDMTNRVLEETLDAIKSVEASSHTQQTLFGEELVWDVADFEIKPKVIAETKRIISSDKNAFSKIVRNAESLKRVGNILQDDVNVEQKNTLDQALELIDRMKYAQGDEIAEVFNKATSHVQAGGSIKDAGEQAAKEIIDLISEGEYLKGLMGKLPKAETVETDTIPGQTSLFGEEPAQAEQTPITEPTKGGVTSGETGISQSEDSKDSPKVPRRTEADAKADAGRNLETEEGKPEVAQAEKPATEPKPQSTGTLSDYDLTIKKATTKNGNPVWELKGVKKDDTDMINVMRKFRARWYGPKKAWSFYQEEDPTPKILAEIEKVKPKKTKPAETTSAGDSKPINKGKYGVGDRVSYHGHTGTVLDDSGDSLEILMDPNALGIETHSFVDKDSKDLLLIKPKSPDRTPETKPAQETKQPEIKTPKPDTTDKYMGFKENDRVKFTLKGKELTGTIKSLDDYSNISPNLGMVADVDVDQIEHAGGVPIGRREIVSLKMLNKLEAPGKEDTKAPAETKPKETTTKTDTTPAKKGIIESEESKGGTSDVRQGDTQKPTGMPTDNVPSTNEGGRTGSVPGTERGAGRPAIPSDGASLQEVVSGTRGSELSETPATEQLDRHDDEKASPRGDSSSRRGGNDRQLEGSKNYKIPTDANIDAGGVQTKYKGNIDAIKLLKQLEAEGRMATPAEQDILAKYSGWGGIPQAFDSRNNKWSKEYSEVKSLLTQEEYEAAKGSTLNAHYTDVGIIRGMYDGLIRMGFEGGKILDPSTGTGRFIGAMPDKLRHSKVTAVELDSLTARIAKQLYPKSSVHNKGFEEVAMPDNFFDLAISNIPFGSYKLHDPKYNKHNFLIHDYFFAKSLDKVKPGGVVAFITSKGTMDKANPKVRKYISDQADLIGAIRLPNTTFKKSANTSVTTDVIFLRKREAGQPQGGEPWFAIKKTKDGVPVNEYYINNPEMMLGTMVYDKSMYGDEKETALHPLDGDLMQAFNEAINKLPENILKSSSTVETDTSIADDFVMGGVAGAELKENEYTIKDGVVYQYQEGQLIPVKQKVQGVMVNVSGKRKERISGMISVKNALREVFRTQRENSSDRQIELARKNLNKMYDLFVKKNGYINDNSNKLAFGEDPDYPLLTTLETYNSKSEKYEKTSVFRERTIVPESVVSRAETSSDALAITLNEKGRVDIDRIAELVGKSQEEAVNDLQGIIFQTPAGDWQTADEYLSGNVRVKLAEARIAAEDNPKFYSNVKALEKVQPKDLRANEISVRLGSNWVGNDTVSEFVNFLLGTDDAKATYIRQTGEWQLKARSTNLAVSEGKYGTRRADAVSLLDKILNNRTINVYDTVDDKRVINKKETDIAREKADLIKREFQNWVYKDADRRKRLEQRYNEMFNSTVLRKYNGEFLTFPGMTANIELRDYQKNAVARMVFGGNTLLAHAVGAGKTFEMIAAGMELKRLGIAHKPVYVVPNHMIEQWQKDFFKLYPNANVLAATRKDFSKNRRARFISMIATGNWDAVIISHSSFGKIGVSKRTQEAFMREEIADVEAAIISAREAEGKGSSIVKQLEKTKASLESRLKELADSESKDTYVDFEDLGIDYLFVDEAHNFKNLYFHTKMGRVAGVSNSKAKRASDMYMKTRYVSGLHNNERGVVFATGTPISNSMPEMFTMQRYLSLPSLERAGLKHFDAWANAFGETVTDLEIDTTGKGIRTKQRFSKFFNAPELITAFRDFADVITSDQLKIERPELDGGKPKIISVDASDTLNEYIKTLIARSDAVASGSVNPSEDNALKITNDGRLAALDMRLIDPSLPDDPNSKLNKAVETIFKEWEDGIDDKTTQLVFSDLGTPKDNKKTAPKKQDTLLDDADDSNIEEDNTPQFDVNFDIYNDVKQKLIGMGIPENEIAFIHDANTDIQKEKLFEKVRRGEVRIIMGSTAKMGEGTNIQDRAIALHHLDAPWKPSSVEQRNGRIIRSGNMNKKVRVYHYVTKGSFDAYIWQLIENKAKFISQIMNNNLASREFEDAFDPVVLSSGEIKASASDNPLIMEKLRVDKEVNRLETLKSSHLSQLYEAEDRVANLPNVIKKKELRLENIKKDIANVVDTKGDKFSMRLKNGRIVTERKKAGEAIQNAAAVSKYREEVLVGTISGFEILGTKSFGGDQIIVRGNNDYRLDVTETPQGTAIAVENLLRNLPKEAAKAEEEITMYEENLKSYQDMLNAPFEHEQTLNDLYKKQSEINNALNLDKRDSIVVDESETDNDDSDGDTGIAQRPMPSRKNATGVQARTKSKDSSGVQARTSSATSSFFAGGKEKTAKVPKPISRTELVDFISEYLDIPIKQGKFRERALGIFKEHPEVIRLKDGKDIETLFHEMGHYFDKKLGLMDEKYLGELYALGIPASKDSYNEKQVMGEGIAEFVRIFTVDPAEAKALAPEFYKDFMKKIALSPGMKDFFDTVKTATINYINQDFENRILGNISVGPNKKKAAFLSRDTLDRIYTAAFDNLHPLKRAVDIITGGEKIDAKDNPFIRAWLYRGVSGKVEAILKYGPIDKNGNKIGKSFEEILSKVDKKSLNDFRAYIVSKHAKELMDEGIATGLSEADVNLTIKKYDNQFEPILKELVEFQRNVLKQLVDAGILSADSYNKITKYEYYVPFNRVMDDTKTSGTGKGLEARNPVYGIKGSSRDIIDPLESIIKNTFIYTNMADRNMIGKAFVDLASKYEGSGKIIDKVPPRMIPQTIMLKELEKVLSSAGADTTEINLDQIATVFRPRGYTNKDNVITVFENGKPTYYEVIDEDLYNAFKSLDQEQTPFYVKILSIPAQVLRAGATGLNVDFIGRNIARDTIFAGISSKYWFIPFVDSIKGLAHVLKKDEIFQSWLYSGGGDSELVSTDRSRMQRYQRNLLQQSGELNVLNIVRHPMDFIRLLGEYSELATRVGVHEKALKKEGDSVSGRMLAGLASRETTVDFSRMGTNVGNINKAIAFFNSALQGGDVLVRAAMRDKGKFALRAIMYITLPSILTYLLNRDDDEYEEIPQYQKDTFWLFKIGGQWWRIPKPFEMGMMFGSLVERFLAYTDKEDPHALDGWAEQLKDSALPDIIPTALLPLIEVWTNHDMFRNMPIIPQGDEYKKPADQYGPYTSSLAKTLGKVFNYSPYKIDHLIKGYGAGVGQNISNIASKGLELTGIAEKKTEPDKPLSEKLPIIRGLTVDPQRSSKSVSDFYDRLNELEDDYKQMRDSDGIELNQYPKRKELRAMRKAQIELRDLNREYKEVYADNKMDAKTKREKLSKINLERINVARKALGKPKIRE